MSLKVGLYTILDGIWLLRKARGFRKLMSPSPGRSSRLMNPVVTLPLLCMAAGLEKLVQRHYNIHSKSMIWVLVSTL